MTERQRNIVSIAAIVISSLAIVWNVALLLGLFG